MVAMLCFQLGAALAKGLFPVVGAGRYGGAAFGVAALMLLAVWRPWRIRLTCAADAHDRRLWRGDGMDELFFYLALSYIPLGRRDGTGVHGSARRCACSASRRPIDFLWIVLAALGLVALLPLGSGRPNLITYSVCSTRSAAGACWALYIFFGRKAGAAHGGQITALGTVIGAVDDRADRVCAQRARAAPPGDFAGRIGVAVLSSAFPTRWKCMPCRGCRPVPSAS